jgi:hypothetical protein
MIPEHPFVGGGKTSTVRTSKVGASEACHRPRVLVAETNFLNSVTLEHAFNEVCLDLKVTPTEAAESLL